MITMWLKHSSHVRKLLNKDDGETGFGSRALDLCGHLVTHPLLHQRFTRAPHPLITPENTVSPLFRCLRPSTYFLSPFILLRLPDRSS